MSGGRPSRGAKVRYREVESDDSDYEYDDEFTKVVTIEPIHDDSDDEDYSPGDTGLTSEGVPAPKVVYPPLSPIQEKLKKVCRLGDKELLCSFLTDNPGIELDVKDPDGGTLLAEACTKTAQFCDIADVLIQSGAGLEVRDSLGNTPLHNAVLYYPSTQKTVDLLLKQGANISAKNNDGVMPEGLAEDKDLKLVLKELRKAAGRKKCINTAVSLYLNSPQLKKKVFDSALMEERFKQVITVKFNAPVIVNSPGLLKRKRKHECLDDSIDERSKKRIRWCELDSTGAEIDPQFSSEEESNNSQDEDGDEQEDHNCDPKADSEEDVVIIHDNVKKGQMLQSDTELCLVKHTGKNVDSDTEEVKTCFYEESPAPVLHDPQVVDGAFLKSDDNLNEICDDKPSLDESSTEDNVLDGVSSDLGSSDKEPTQIQIESSDHKNATSDNQSFLDVKKLEATPSKDSTNMSTSHTKFSSPVQMKQTSIQSFFSSTNVTNNSSSDFSEKKEETDEDLSESKDDEDQSDGQLLLKCSQGFGFFVS